MFTRLINPIKSNSFFLFGARGTGKSTFLASFFAGEKVLWIDLLDSEIEDRYLRRPSDLRDQLAANRLTAEPNSWVVIDEIQRAPKLLDVVHSEIEKFGTKFALTGSSARKLKLGGANLLAGRAFMNHLFPLTHIEIAERFDLNEVLRWGALPKIYQLTSEREKTAFLKAYSRTYLREEVWGEQLVRNIENFRKFLEISAVTSGHIVNYTNIARDVGNDPKTVQNYFGILEDTLIGFFLPSFDRSVRKQQNVAPKFYLFDTGVQRSLAGLLTVDVLPQTTGYGRLFEQFVISEFFRLNEYFETEFKFSYLKTKDNAEIDLIIERPGNSLLLIEIKSRDRINQSHVKVLKNFIGSFDNCKALCISQDPIEKLIDGIRCLHWRQAFKEVFANALSNWDK
jgi:uncharacterized protein